MYFQRRELDGKDPNLVPLALKQNSIARPQLLLGSDAEKHIPVPSNMGFPSFLLGFTPLAVVGRR